jgi:peptide/nickel transport system permease protein
VEDRLAFPTSAPPADLPRAARLTLEAGGSDRRTPRPLAAVGRIPYGARLCLLVSVGLLLAALFAPWIAPKDPDRTDLLSRLDPPSFVGGRTESWLGTDQLGRDALSRCLYGLRTSVGIALAGLIIGCALGTSLGLVSGALGGLLDTLLMMLVDVQIAIPFLLIVLVGIVLCGTDVSVLVVLVGIAGWETYARLIRGQVLAVRETTYVEACRALGTGTVRLVFRHILPNVASPLIVLATLNFPHILLLESSLSFLGIGVQPPTASLGRMVGEGRDYMVTAWWVVACPAGLILTVTLVVQTLGDWLRDLLDVRLV